MKLVLAVATLCVALLVPSAFAGTTATTTLNGTVGPGFTIKLTKAGVKVTTLKAGTYKFVIADKSSIHNFHLTGPGLNKTTSVGGTGTTTWKLTLKKGTYKYICDPHASFMKVSFKVS
jgi:plastocyanin